MVGSKSHSLASLPARRKGIGNPIRASDRADRALLQSLMSRAVQCRVGRLHILTDVLGPVIEVLPYLSPTAMIPIAVIWYGIGENSKYFLIFWGTFFFVLINTIAGVMRTPIARQRAAQCLGANNFQIF